MAGEDHDDDQQPSLELPSLSLRRRGRRRERTARPTADNPVPAVESQPAPAVEQRSVPTSERVAVDDPIEPAADVPAPRPGPRPSRRRRRRQRVAVPAMSGPVVAMLAGLVVGFGLVGLTWAFLASCGALRGTTSCGAAGYPLVALVFVAMAVVATLLLRLARVPEPTSTGLLGLGLTGVVALLFLAGTLLSVWMALVIPLVTAATFALSHWLTTAATAD